nr:hypothetical protein [Tanacetum cinerariifolium]
MEDKLTREERMGFKAFRVFNSRRRIVEENLHIRFSKSTPNVLGSGPDWLFDIDALTKTMNYEPIVAGTQSNSFAGIKASDNAGQARNKTKPIKDYIFLPLWTANPPFSQDPKSSHNDGSKPSSNDGKKVDEDPRNENEYVIIFNFSSDDEDDGAIADMNKLDTTIQVSLFSTTRIHKDHPLDQVIEDLKTSIQTRKMSKNLEEHWDKIICDLNKTPNLSQRPPHNCPKCENPIDGQYCQGCALLRKKFKEDLFTYCIENGIFQDFQDTSEPSNDNTNVVNAFKSHSLSNKTPVKIPHKVLHKSTTIVVTVSAIPQPPREEISVEFLQEKRNQIDYVKTFLRKFNRISFYKMPKVLSLAWETILEIELAFEDNHCQPEDILELFQRLHNDVQNIHKELAVYINTPSWDRPTVCYSNDNDEDCTIAITPILSTEEPNNSLSMGDDHLDTIPATESDEFIKSSVENLVPIQSESEGIPDNMCDVPFHDNSPPLDVSKDQFEDFFDSNDDSNLIDDDSFSIDNIEYVEASPLDYELVSLEVMEIVIPKIGGIDDDILLTTKDDILHENC